MSIRVVKILLNMFKNSSFIARFLNNSVRVSKMKIFIALFALITVIVAAPMTISDNNIGDISYISVHANGVLSSNIEGKIATIVAALQNQQAVLANGDLPPLEITPTKSEESIPQISPELIKEIENIEITPELIEDVKKILVH